MTLSDRMHAIADELEAEAESADGAADSYKGEHAYSAATGWSGRAQGLRMAAERIRKALEESETEDDDPLIESAVKCIELMGASGDV